MTCAGGKMQWSRVVACVASVRIRSMLQEQPDDITLTMCRRSVERRAAVSITQASQRRVDDQELSDHA